MKLLTFPVLGTTLYHIIHNKKNIRYNLEEKFFYNPFKINTKLYNMAWKQTHNSNGNDRYFYASIQGNYLNWDITNALQKLDLPVTILYTTKYRNQKDICRSYVNLNNRFKLRPIKGCGTLPQIENPDLLYETMKECF